MKTSLESLLEKVDISLDTGQFILPDEIEGRRVIRYFLEHARKQKEHPIVVIEEKYTRQSVMYKVGEERCYNSNRNLVIALLDYGLLRFNPNRNGEVNRMIIDNLSLAQIISYAYKVPIEEVLVSKKEFSSSKFKSQDIQTIMRTLVNAYTGTSWFERFKRKYKRRKKNQQFVIWHNISMTQLPRLLCISDYEPGDSAGNLTKLVKSGFIIPRDKFKRFSSRNFVDVNALAEFASQITRRPFNEVICYDSYIFNIAKEFISQRLIPKMRERRLGLNQLLTLEQVRHMTGQDSDILCKALKIKANRKKRFYSKETPIKAIDFAIYELKNTYQMFFEERDIARLFGMKEINLKRCNIYSTSKNTYSRHHSVFPFYDSVAKVAKKLLLDKVSEKIRMPLRINGDTYYITNRTVKSYTSVYDLDEFTSECYDHIAECIRKGTRIQNTIKSEQLILNLSNDEIKSVKINIGGYKVPRQLGESSLILD